MTEPTPIPELLLAGKHVRFLKIGNWEFFERTHACKAVVVFPVTENGEVILISQFRPPVNAHVIEFPAGLIGDEVAHRNEQIVDAAQRELIEETGYRANSMEIVAEGPPSPGLSNETIIMAIAKNLEKINDGGGVDGEDICIYTVPFENVESWLEEKRREGFIIDPKIFGGLYFINKHLDRGKS